MKPEAKKTLEDILKKLMELESYLSVAQNPQEFFAKRSELPRLTNNSGTNSSSYDQQPQVSLEVVNKSIENLRLNFTELKDSLEPELQKLSSLQRVLRPEMTHRELLNLLVPIERMLHKNLTDVEILTDDKTTNTEAKDKLPLVFVLDHLRSSFNVGSIFRTAECLQLSHIYCCGYTATPENIKTKQTAMGTEKWISWTHFDKTEDCLQMLRSRGYRIIALETVRDAKSWDEPYEHQPTAIVLGNERFGISNEVLQLCEEYRNLPVRGIKNSLNVANVASIVAYEWYRQWK
ncbi:MAG: RNA methyltransferase [Bdellovibrionia bacterium]